jgi:DNA-binding NarL/FixJ family response regulator
MTEQALMRTVQVALHASDAVTRAGLSSHVRREARLSEVPQHRSREADLTVVAVDTVDVGTLSLLRSLSDCAQPRFVLVAGRQWQADIFTAIDHGVRAVLWRDTFSPAAFIQALLTVAGGGGSFPPALQGTLMRQVQWTHREVLTPRGLTASGVSPREVDILRLIAEGREMGEIARKLSYSERTVKYLLYGMMKRLNLHNRAHAVSYAIHAGLI